MSPRIFVKILLFLVLISNAWGTQVRATVDATTISLDETITFKVEAENSDFNPSVNISPLLKDFSIVSGPAQQSNFQWINGRATSTKSLSWTLVANHTGTIIIPALEVAVGGKKYRTQPIRVIVKKSGSVKQQGNLFLLVDVDKEEAYVGEQVTLTYKLYTRVKMGIESIDYPKGVGFWVEELSVPRAPRFNTTRLKGVEYRAATLYKVAMFPTKTGDLSVDPMTVKCQVQVERRRRSIWDEPFFDSFFTETVPRVLRTEPVSIHVKPYPEGQPADFTGAVGQFQIQAFLDTNHVKVNEAVTLNILLQGTGNLNMFSLPELNFPNNMDVFPPTSTFEQKAMWDQFTGKITYEYILIPRSPGKYQLPKIYLTYFDPRSAQWQQAVSRPLTLSVAPARNAPLAAGSGFTKKEIALLGEDIRYNKTQVPRWIRRDHRPLSAWIWSVYGLAAFFWLLPATVNQMQSRRQATYKLRMSQRALKQALRALRKPEADLFAQVAKVIYRYLKQRFLLSTDKLDPLRVETLFTGKMDPDQLHSLVTLLKQCDAGRYAPGAEQAQQNLLQDAKKLLQEVDKCDF